MNIILHIGWYKTGTTAIQEFLFDNALRLKKNCKIYYPNEGLFANAHHVFAWALQNKMDTPWGNLLLNSKVFEQKLTLAIDNAKLIGCKTILLSSEDFCTLDEGKLKFLRGVLSELASKVKIIVYLRRQDLLMESSYNMEVKWWGSRMTLPFDDYIKGKEGFPNYYEILKVWERIFGREALVIRPYDEKYLNSKDVRIDFCKSAGINHSALHFTAGRSNQSLGPAGIEFMRILNHLSLPREVHGGIVTRLFEHEKAQHASACVFFNPDERKRFLSYYESGNSRLHSLDFDSQSFRFHPHDAKKNNEHQLSLDEFIKLLKITLNYEND